MPRHLPIPRRLPLWLRLTAAGVVVLLAAIGYQVWREAQRAPAATAPLVTFAVDGLDCPVWCSVRLAEAIDALDGARVVEIDREAGTVLVRHDPARQDVPSLRELIEARGFPVLTVTSKPAAR